MKQRKPLKRSTKPIKRTAIKKARSKPRPGRLEGDDLEALRLACWERDKGHCQECGWLTVYDLPQEWSTSYHMAHIQAKRRGGDSLANVRVLCGSCHRKSHAYGPSMEKPCPPKSIDTD